MMESFPGRILSKGPKDMHFTLYDMFPKNAKVSKVRFLLYTQDKKHKANCQEGTP